MNIKQILIIIIIFTSLIINSGSSQKLVEDFTIIDVNGNEINLYEMLDDGKIVIVNLFSVDCSSCIDYDKLNILESMWQQYGPSGTNELFIISIESHPETEESDIFTGDHAAFMQGLLHPLANADIGGHFDMGYYSLVEICANKIATKIPTVGNNSIYNNPYPGASENCVSDSLDLDVMILDTYIPSWVEVCDDGMYFNPELIIQNVGHDTISELKIVLSQDGNAVDSVDITEEITRHEVQTIFLPELFLYSQYSIVEIEITRVNNETGDDELENNYLEQYCIMESAISNYNNNITDPIVNIVITTGSNGHEIYWAILDENEEIIFEGGNLNEVGIQGGGANNSTIGNGYRNDTTYWENVILPNEGCYEFVFVDGGGNITSNGYMQYRLWSNDTTQVIASKNFKYASYDKRQFEYSTTSSAVELLEDAKLKLIPNPVLNNEFTIQIDAINLNELSYEVLNINGELIKRRENIYLPNEATNSIQVKLPVLPDGLYIVNVKGDNLNLTEKIMVISN